ncbi:MAG: hypothetical protein PWP08_312 [Methanofollis sp.]|nr:hypothetical protein [Methanofollis sp.]
MVDALSATAAAGYLVRAVALITVGIVVANVITETGIISRLKFLSCPISRISGISSRSSLALVTMVADATAGKSMLAEFYHDGSVRREEVVPTLLMGTFPTVLGESLFRVQLPTAIVLLGPVIGGIYTGLNILSALIQTTGAIVWVRLIRKNAGGVLQDEEEPARVGLDRLTIRAGVVKAFSSLKRIVPITVAATIVFFILSSTGVVDLVAAVFAPVLGLIGVPGESIAAIVAQALHFSAGYAVVGSLMAGGILSMEQALITLIAGSMVVITMIYIKYSVSIYLSLFGDEGPKIIAKTYLASMGAKVATILIVLAVF